MKTFSAALLLCLAVAPTARAQQPQPLFGGSGTSAWSRVYYYLQQRLGATAPDDVVIVEPTATNAAWADGSKTLQLMQMMGWGDTEPAKAWQYTPEPGKRVADGYSYFLTAAYNNKVAADGTITDTVKQAMLNASKEMDFTRDQYNKAVQSGDAAFSNYLTTTPPPRLGKKQYLKKYGYQTIIDAEYEQFQDAQQTFTDIFPQLADPDVKLLKTAKDRFNNPAQQIYLPAVTEVMDEPDLWEKRYLTFIDNNLKTFQNDLKPQHELISEEQHNSDFFEQTWHASASVSFLGLFRAGGASAEQTRREKHIQDNTTKIDIAFDNLDTFPIKRGEWYDGNLLSRFATSLNNDDFKRVFGANGQLEVIPSSLLVGRHMKISLYADSDSLDYLYDHFQGSADAGVFVGYFRIGGQGDYSTTHENVKATKFSDHIEFEDLSGRPQVLAMMAKTYGADKPALLVQQMAAIQQLRARRAQLTRSPQPSEIAKPFLADLPAPERIQVLGQ